MTEQFTVLPGGKYEKQNKSEEERKRMNKKKFQIAPRQVESDQVLISSEAQIGLPWKNYDATEQSINVYSNNGKKIGVIENQDLLDCLSYIDDIKNGVRRKVPSNLSEFAKVSCYMYHKLIRGSKLTEAEGIRNIIADATIEQMGRQVDIESGRECLLELMKD